MLILNIFDQSKWKSGLLELADYAAKYGISESVVQQSAFVVEGCIPSKDIQNMRREIKFGAGCILIRNCPIDDIQYLNTIPTSASRPTHKSWISELVVLGMTHALGFNPFSYLQEKNGALVHEIVPLEGKKNTASSNGIVEFKLHTDGSYLPREIRPATLTLLCLNNESGTDTKLMSLESVIRELSAETIDTLSSNSFIHTPPTTFEVGESSQIVGSILDKVEGHWEMKIATHNCKPIHKKAEKALEQFIQVSDQKAFSHAWKIGDLLMFNNFRCLHGRGKIAGKRWLQRCYGSRLVKTASVLNLTGHAETCLMN